MEITITTQNGLDALPLDFKGIIYITGHIETFNHEFKNAYVYVKNNAVIKNHNGGTIEYVFNKAVIENHNGGIIYNIFGDAVIENNNSGIIYNVRNKAVIKNHNGGRIEYVFNKAVIENHNGGKINNIFGDAVIENNNSGIIYNVQNKAVIKNHNGGRINSVRDNAVIENHNGGTIYNVLDNAVIENNNGGWIDNVRDNAVIENHNGGWINSVRGNAVINTTGGVVYHKANETNIKINNNGGTVIAIQPCDNTFEWFKNSFPVETSGEYVTLYKAVRKRDGKYISDYKDSFEYIIGEEKTEKVDTNVNIECSFGIHLSHKDWAIMFGSDWNDLAILELKVSISDIIVPTKCDGKVRTSKATVVREVPQSE